MLKEWFEDHYKLLKVVLVVLAALNGWIAYAIFPEHPIMASANASMAVVIIAGISFSWRAGRPD